MTDMTEGDSLSDSVDPRTEERFLELLEEFARRLREATGRGLPRPFITQERAAHEIGVSLRQYQRWEHGPPAGPNGGQLPPLERIPRIVEVTGIDVTDLFEPAPGLTRDGIKDYFDNRIEEITTLVQANQSEIQTAQMLVRDALDQLHALNSTILERVEALETRLSEGRSL